MHDHTANASPLPDEKRRDAQNTGEAGYTICRGIPFQRDCVPFGLHRPRSGRLACALVLRQSQARLPEPIRARLLTALDELERLVARIETLLAAVATRTPPRD